MPLFSKEKKKMTRIFFATDIHGSEVTFRKFLNAGSFFKADVLILGGDITGKMIVPIIEKEDGTYEVTFLEQVNKIKDKSELKKFEEKIKNTGFYPYYTSEKEFIELNSNKKLLDSLFLKLMLQTLETWISLAEERLKPQGIKIFITGGNDDPFEIEQILNSSNYVINPEGKVVFIDENHEMISSGYCNRTPWNCPRDVDDEVLEKKLDELIPHVQNMKNCIFNMHAPPRDSGLDTCPMLDNTVYPPKPVTDKGAIKYFGAGSSAVRASIEKHQPLLGLHGHIHESKGIIKIGRTLCFNPGSEYSEGILRGALIILDDEKVVNYQLTSG